MALELKPRSKWWYGRFRDGSKVRQIRLNVAIEGVPPVKAGDQGDAKFEASRRRAQLEFDKQVAEIRGNPMQEKLVQRLAEIKTGKKIAFAKLADLPDLWKAIARRRKPSVRYVSQCVGVLERFVAFVEKTQPAANEFVKVTPETALGFMAAESARGLAPKTWNDELKLLRTTFKHLHPHLTDGSNPFHGLVTQESEEVRRDPFTVEELKLILDASEKDSFIRPIIITGMCTAMRRGDCCLLRWRDVDLKDGFVTVKTAKTGATVDIPLFPMLQDLLGTAKQVAQPKADDYVFPEPAAMYQKSPDGITWRVKKVLAQAFTVKAMTASNIQPMGETNAVRRLGHAYLESLGESPKATRMRQTFDLYLAGANINQVSAQTGQTKSTVSEHLNRIEAGIGVAFIRGKVRIDTKAVLQRVRAEGKGSRLASVRDFHSFRVTWITLALAAGVPLELVKRVTGHRTVEIVLEHYFRPGRDDFKQRILEAMPRLLSGDGQTADRRLQTEDAYNAGGEATTKQAKSAKGDELVVLAGKVAAGVATDGEKARLRELLAVA